MILIKKVLFIYNNETNQLV